MGIVSEIYLFMQSLCIHLCTTYSCLW